MLKIAFCFPQKILGVLNQHTDDNSKNKLNALGVVFSVFISHVIKTKNRNRSINEFKNLGYDR